MVLLLALVTVLVVSTAGEHSGQAQTGPELQFTTVIPGIGRSVKAEGPIIDAIRAALPTTMPSSSTTGWPMHALTGAITWARIGETQRATEWADTFWSMRDAQSGLWVNQMGYTDMVNPYLATVLFELLGQHERAVETSLNVIEWSRTHLWGVYNAHWFAALSAAVVGEPMPEDIVALAWPGFEGRYGALEEMQDITPKGRYYADVMLAHWRQWGGPTVEEMPYLADETEYCPLLSVGGEECEAFYRWTRHEAFIPVLSDPYGFYTDGVIFFSLPGLTLGIEPAVLALEY